MGIYNITFMDNVTNPADIMTGVGASTGQPYLFGYLMLFSVFLIYVIYMMKNDEFTSVIISGGFLTAILAILFYAAEIVPATTIVYPVVVAIIGVIFHLTT